MTGRGSKIRNRRAPKPESSGHHGEAFCVVHMPIVHGIGVASEEAWAKASVGRVESWLVHGSRTAWVATHCIRDVCSPSQHHRHLRSGADRIELVLDPIGWGEFTPLPSKTTTALWITRAGFQALFLYVAAGWWRRVVRLLPKEETRLSIRGLLSLRAMKDTYGGLTRALFDVLSFSLFCMALIPTSLAIVPLLATSAFTPPGHRFLGHPMAWTHDDGAHHSYILEYVSKRLRAVPSDRQIRVGHSQGGSILAELVRRGRSDDRSWTVTLGSGHALLAALSHGRRDSRALSIWPLALLLFLMFGILAVGALPVLPALTLTISGILAMTVTQSMALWTALADPRLSLMLQVLDVPSRQAFAEQLLSQMGAASHVDWRALLPFTVTSTVLGLWIRANMARLERITAASDLPAQGFDLIATHDPVSTLLAAQTALLGSLLSLNGRAWRSTTFATSTMINSFSSHSKRQSSP